MKGLGARSLALISFFTFFPSFLGRDTRSFILRLRLLFTGTHISLSFRFLSDASSRQSRTTRSADDPKSLFCVKRFPSSWKLVSTL